MTISSVETASRVGTPNAPSRPAATVTAGDDPAVRLAALRQSSATRETLLHRLMKWLSGRPGVAAAACYTQPGDDQPRLHAGTFDGPVFDHLDWREAADTAIATAVATAAVARVTPHQVRNVTLLAVAASPATAENDESAAFVAAVVKGGSAASAESSLLACVAELGRWDAERRAVEVRRSLRLTAATLELTGEIAAAGNPRAAHVSVVNTVREHLGCRAVALGVVRRGRVRVAAVSGSAGVDGGAATTRRIATAMNESRLRGGRAVSPSESGTRGDSLLAHDRLRQETAAARVISQPLVTTGGDTVGVWLVIEDAEGSADEPRPLLTSAAAPVADALASARRSRRGTAGARPWRGWMIAAIVCAAAVAAMGMPVDYVVTCPCRTEAVSRRYVVAPFDGVLRATHLRPGDAVRRGEVLARIDGRDLQWELASLAAEEAEASKTIDTSLVAGDAAAAQLATLERDRIAARRAVIERRLSQLELVSPVDGVILEGDLTRVENAPVERGQSLYEVAPLETLLVEVAIPAEDFTRFAAGSGVSVRLEGGDGPVDGRIERVHPQSEVREGRNVFVAEVAVRNPDGRLRPGMSGFARVRGEDVTLGWSLFHKPWQKLRASIPVGW